MSLPKNLSIFLVIAIGCLAAAAQAARFNITNRCRYTVWAAAVPGGGRRLDTNQTWTLNNVSDGTMGGRIWGRTNCTFDQAGRGKCLTGDCSGLLECNSTGTPPYTLVEYALNQYNNLNFYDISVVEGFNVPVQFSSTANASTSVRCSADINGECPSQLKAPGGCNNPCTVFNSSQYCCTGSGKCGPTNYSQFFKTRCPDACSYPKDDATSTFTSPGGSNFTVVFCP